jgi:hypothetical protein
MSSYGSGLAVPLRVTEVTGLWDSSRSGGPRTIQRDSGTSFTRVTLAARRQSIPRSVIGRLTPAVDSTSRGRGAAC